MCNCDEEIHAVKSSNTSPLLSSQSKQGRLYKRLTLYWRKVNDRPGALAPCFTRLNDKAINFL